MSEEALNLDELAGGAGDDAGQDTKDQLSAGEGEGKEAEAGADAKQPSGAAQEAADDASKAAKVKSDDGERVPLAVLMEERRKAREAQQELAALKQRLEAKNEPAKTEDKEVAPDYLKDPTGYIEWQRRQAEKQISSQLEPIAQDYQQRQQAAQHQQQVQQIITQAAAYEADFIKAQPAYHDALAHIRGLRMAEAQALGIPEHQARQAMINQELQLAAYALQNGRNPAELAFNLARSLGFNPESNASAQAQQKSPEELAEEQALLAARKDAARTMGGNGGADVDDLLDADNDEFEAAMQSMFPRRK